VSRISGEDSWSFLSPRRFASDIARHDPRSPALLAPGRAPLSYGALLHEIARNVHALAAAGYGQGARVALAMPNGPELAALFLALIDCTTAVPLDPVVDEATCRHLLTTMRVDALIVASDAETTAVRVARDLGVALVRASVATANPAGVARLDFERARPAVAARPPAADTVALLLHTSGTTALPKRVPQTSRHLAAMPAARVARLGLTAADRVLSLTPLHTSSGVRRNLLMTLSAGAGLVCVERFEPDAFFDWLRELQPTIYVGTPTIHRAVLDLAERHGRPEHALRFALSTSAPLPDATHERFEALLGVPLLQAYAMTEAGAIAESPPPPGARRLGAVGLPAGSEIAITDADGRRCATGDVGEVVVRGPEVFEGYADDPVATAAAFRDGWFRTGDLGRLDDDGYLRLVGRVKELVNRGGFKVSPSEVDGVLQAHPAVADAATIGVPHPTLGEDVVALVALRVPGTAVASELRAWALARLTPFKVPSRIAIVAAIPRTAMGKLQRRELAALFGASSGVKFVAPQGVHEALVADAFGDVLAREAVGANDNFFDLGGDSLRAARVAARLGAALVRDVEPSMLFLHPVVAELAVALAALPASAVADAAPIVPRRRGAADREAR
jgi:acyl-CoA synthetase (AMP-forming)/AMP-acid ligase II